MRKETLILAGMPGSGKTMFSENIVCAYGENKETIFSRNTMRGKLGVCKPGERAVLPNPFGLKVTVQHNLYNIIQVNIFLFHPTTTF